MKVSRLSSNLFFEELMLNKQHLLFKKQLLLQTQARNVYDIPFFKKATVIVKASKEKLKKKLKPLLAYTLMMSDTKPKFFFSPKGFRACTFSLNKKALQRFFFLESKFYKDNRFYKNLSKKKSLLLKFNTLGFFPDISYMAFMCGIPPKIFYRLNY